MAGRLGTSGRAAQCAGDESGERNKHGRAWAQPAVDADAGWGLWFRKSGGCRGESGDPALFRTRASRFTVHVDPFSFSSSDPAYGRPYRVPACTASSLLPARRPRFLQPAVDRFSLRFIQSIFGTGVGLAVINISISLSPNAQPPRLRSEGAVQVQYQGRIESATHSDQLTGRQAVQESRNPAQGFHLPKEIAGLRLFGCAPADWSYRWKSRAATGSVPAPRSQYARV